MAGQLTISTLSDGTNSTSSTNCIQGSAKAWVNFNSSGTIQAAYNVSSVTKSTTGTYVVNFTNAMADAKYSAVTGTSSNSSPANGGGWAATISATSSASSVGLYVGVNTNVYDVVGMICLTVFR